MSNTERGFTLVELIVVIIILGILAATAVPKFVDMQQSATDARTNFNAGSAATDADVAVAKCMASNAGASTFAQCTTANPGGSQ